MGHEIKAGEKEEEWLLFLCSLDTMTSGYGAFHCNCFNLFKKAFQKDFCTVAF